MNKKYDKWHWPRDKVPDGILTFARENRKNATAAENLLWTFLRNRKLQGFKFRRQQPIQHFIVDFFCEEVRLAVEVDGEIHQTNEHQSADEARTRFLNRYGIQVIRFSNARVLNSTNEVLEEILKTVKSLTPAPLPRERVPGGQGEG